MGELLWDVFPDGPLLGGSSANVAYHAAALGARAHLISRVGNDTLGRLALEKLASSHVDVSLVQIDPILPTGQVFVTVEEGEPRFEIGKMAAWDRISVSPQAHSTLGAADVICFGTLAQRTKWMETQFRHELRRLSNRGSPWFFGDWSLGDSSFGKNGRTRPLLFLDLNLRPPHTDRETILGSLRLADVVKLNERELAWVGECCPGRSAVQWIFENSPARLLALTHGAEGASLLGRQVHLSTPGIRVNGGDAVGAGDAFVASLAHSLASRVALPRALSKANTYAAWVASQVGAMPAPKST